MLRKILLFFALVVIGLLSLVSLNTWRFTPPPALALASAPVVPVSDSAVAHFRQALRFQTVSYEDSTHVDTGQFLGFRRFLRRAYPLLHQRLMCEHVGGYSLVYRWQGRNTQLPPAILLAHQDVVPVEAETRSQWRFPPFSGTVAEGQVWGRGATDNKANLTALLESVEHLLTQNFQPERTVYLVFGHDEEIGGWFGARRVAALLQRRGIVPAFVLDEGGFVTTQRVPGMTGKPVALIGTAEKGYLSLQLSAAVPGGHASMPETTTAIDLVSRALVVLREHSFPASLTQPMLGFAEHIGPHLPLLQRMAFANRWLFSSLILKTYLKTPGGAAAVHTTMVPTIYRSGVKDNVVPGVAVATINLRLLPGESVQSVTHQVRAWLPDPRVTVHPIGLVAEPSAASAPTSALGYQVIERNIRQQSRSAVVTPFLFVALSDSRHFAGLTPNIYKFSPMTDPVGLHGVNEHLSLLSFRQCQGFYQGLLSEL